MQTRVQLLMSLAAAALLAAASPHAAAQSTWNLGGSTCNPDYAGTPNTATCTVGSLTANIWALGNNGTNGVFKLGQVADYDPSGFGAYTGTNETGYNNQHAFDNATTGCGANSGSSTNSNCGGSQELMLLKFSTAVNLTQMAIGFWGSDADVSILRWDGPADGTTNQVNAGNTLQYQTASNYTGTFNSSTQAGGWTLVSSMDLLNDAAAVTGNNPNGGTANTKVFNTSAGTGYSSSNLVSSWWIISTYNGGATGNSNLQNNGLDAFKILTFTVNTCSGTVTGNSTNGTCTAQTPEPGTLALTALALAGLVAGRRRLLARSNRSGLALKG